jgi:hypothetical protein
MQVVASRSVSGDREALRSVPRRDDPERRLSVGIRRSDDLQVAGVAIGVRITLAGFSEMQWKARLR